MGCEHVPPKILDLLQKLKERTVDKGCTEGEMHAAAQKIKQLLQEYDISMMDVGTKEYKVNATTGIYKSGYRYLPAHMIRLANAVARGFECKLVYKDNAYFPESNDYGTRLTFIGMEVDVEVSLFFYPVLWNKVNDWCKIMMKQRGIKGRYDNKNEYEVNFWLAAAEELEKRLKGEREATGSVGTEIVLAKNVKINELVRQLFPVLGRGKQINIAGNAQATADGRYAGQNIHLTRGMGGNGGGNGGQLGGSNKGLPSK